jgi:acyl-CoA synthetase (AMP-forming)/AMP-acid ligase II
VSSETIAALLAARRAERPDHVAMVDDHGRLTYAELEERSAAIAAELVRRGVNKGHRTALLMPNGIDWALAAYAVMRVGAVLVPLSTLLRPPELSQQLAVANVRHLVFTETHRGRDYLADLATLDRDALPSLENVWRWRGLATAIGAAPDLAMVAAYQTRLRPADDMAVVFTSGSAGAPKGVIHTHGGAIRAVAAGLDSRGVGPDTRLYLPMPFFWVGGFAGGLLSALIAGATLVTEEAPDPQRTLALLAREKVTLFRGWPDQALQLARHPDFARHDLSALRPGSLEALLPTPLRSAAGARANLFGMTESFGPYCGWWLDRDLPAEGWGSCGKPFADLELRIVDPETGAASPPGEAGVIQIRGPNILRGICGREREAVFTPDGWYDTGDLGGLSPDGFLYFAGRHDDMFKVKGTSVHPSEVEQALASIPGVRRAFAAAVDIDGVLTVGAAVLPEPGETLALDRLSEAARGRLSAFKLPSRWLLLRGLEELPTLASGKLDRAALAARLVGGQPTP